MPTPNRQLLGFVVSFVRELVSFKKFNRTNGFNAASSLVSCLFAKPEELDSNKFFSEVTLPFKLMIELPVKLSMPLLRHATNNTKYTPDESNSS